MDYASWRRVSATFLVASGCMTATPALSACGEVVTLATHGNTTTAYSLALPAPSAPQENRVALVLLAGGPGYLSLDGQG